MADTVYKEIVKVIHAMKFVKRISLFFIYPVTMFGMGFAANMAIYEFFYPGPVQNEKNETTAHEEEILPGEPVVETGYQAEPVITADTSYIVLSYDALSGELQENDEAPPDKYIGLSRQELEGELKVYEGSPSLTDLEKGFSHIELLSFSPARVVVRKSYEREEEGFFLVNENHSVVVYDRSLTHVYMDTGILVEELPWMIQREILHMKYIETENELYNFLESYSS